MKPADLIKLKYTNQAIYNKRAEIRAGFLDRSQNIHDGKITRLSNLDLEILFQLYDAFFLRSYFAEQFKGTLRFTLSTRMTRSAGMIHSPRNLPSLRPEEEHYEIKIGTGFLFNYSQLERDKRVNGIISRDSLEALQLVLEHEICHLVELHTCKTSSCRRQPFKSLALQLFAHTEGHHHLPTGKEIAAVRDGFLPGMKVRFQHGGVTYSGVIYRITQRATVMVPQPRGDFQDSRGNRYEKYYVPLAELTAE